MTITFKTITDMKRFLTYAAAMLALVFFASCEEEETIQAIIDEAELTLSEETVYFSSEAGEFAEIQITSDQTVFDVNVDYAYKNWLAAELEGTVITVRAIQPNPTSEERTGVISVVAGEKGVTATAYVSVVQAANESIPVLELSTDRVNLPQDASESVSVDVTTNQDITLTVDDAATSWCSAKYEDGKIVITALSANTGAGDRTATITVTAGTLTDEITAVQGGEATSFLGKAYGTEGVIFWIDPEEPTRAKIISAQAFAGQPWSEENPAVLVGANNESEDGTVNFNIIKQTPNYRTANYGALKCEEMGEGWYMPSPDELEALFTAYNGISISDGATNAIPAEITEAEKASRAAFEATMLSIGGVMINTQAETANGDSIWSNKEDSADNAVYIRFGKYGRAGAKKSGTARNVRCVKVVTLE